MFIQFKCKEENLEDISELDCCAKMPPCHHPLALDMASSPLDLCTPLATVKMTYFLEILSREQYSNKGFNLFYAFQNTFQQLNLYQSKYKGDLPELVHWSKTDIPESKTVISRQMGCLKENNREIQFNIKVLL